MQLLTNNFQGFFARKSNDGSVSFKKYRITTEITKDDVMIYLHEYDEYLEQYFKEETVRVSYAFQSFEKSREQALKEAYERWGIQLAKH